MKSMVLNEHSIIILFFCLSLSLWTACLQGDGVWRPVVGPSPAEGGGGFARTPPPPPGYGPDMSAIAEFFVTLDSRTVTKYYCLLLIQRHHLAARHYASAAFVIVGISVCESVRNTRASCPNGLTDKITVTTMYRRLSVSSGQV